jgi:hypothetical protein
MVNNLFSLGGVCQLQRRQPQFYDTTYSTLSAITVNMSAATVHFTVLS